MSVCETIFNQLGGNRFAYITGTKNFVSDGNTLRMTIIRNKSKANRLYVTYNPDKDLYTMEFWKVTPFRFYAKTGKMIPEKWVSVKKIEDVFCDQLSEIFEDVTGIYTRIW